MLQKDEKEYLEKGLKRRFYSMFCKKEEAAKIISILRKNGTNTENLEGDYESIYNCPFELINEPTINLVESDIQLIDNIKITLSGSNKELLNSSYKKIVEAYCMHKEFIKLTKNVLNFTNKLLRSKYIQENIKSATQLRTESEIILNKL